MLRDPMNTDEIHERFPSALQAALIVLGLFGAEYLVGAALYDARSLLGLSDDDASALVTLLGNAIVFVLVLQHKRIGYRALFQPGRHSMVATLLLTALPIALLMPLLVLGMSAAMGLLVQALPMSASDEAMFERMATDSFASVVAACVLAPVLEEMLFRGVFLRSFLRQYDRWTAIALSSVLFGLAHLNVYQFVVGCALGLLAGWLYERTQSLAPSIVLHAGYNSSLTLLDAWERDAGVPPDGYLMSTWGLAAGLALAGAVVLRRMLVR